MILEKFKKNILVIIACMFVFLSQQNYACIKSNRPTRTIISGRILHPNETTVKNISLRVYLYDDITKDYYQDDASISSDGSFKFVIEESRVSEVSMTLGDKYLLKNLYGVNVIIIEPGDSLYFVIPSISSSELHEVKVFGRGSETQIYFNDLVTKLQSIDNEKELAKEYEQKKITLNQYYERIVKRIEKQIDIVKLSTTQNPVGLSNEILEAIKAKLLATFHYSFQNIFLNADISNKVVKNLYDGFEKRHPLKTELNIDKPDAIRMGSTYWSAFRGWAQLRYIRLNGGSWFGNEVYKPTKDIKGITFDIMLSMHRDLPNNLKSELLSRYIALIIKGQGINEYVMDLWTKYAETVEKEDRYLIQLSNYIQTKKDFTHIVGNGFTLTDTIGQKIDLRQFEGNVVLIDFMFWGCAGCATMAPTLSELEDSFKGKDVVFISVSIDKTMERFKKGTRGFMAQNSIPLFTDGKGSNHDIIKFYDVVAYPTLVVLDKKGFILMQRAPDPRQPKQKEELAKIIDSAL